MICDNNYRLKLNNLASMQEVAEGEIKEKVIVEEEAKREVRDEEEESIVKWTSCKVLKQLQRNYIK